MNLKNLFVAGAAAAMLCVGMTGCNENPIDTTVNPMPPTGLLANSASSTSVNLKWTASADTGITGYDVTWTGPNSGSKIDVGGTSNTITGLNSNATYTFTVMAKRGTASSTGITTTWAGADRYNTDQNNSETLRLYEFASSEGSGLQVDPVVSTSLNGPRNVKTSNANPVLSSVQLAVDINTTTGKFTIGAAHGFGVGSFANIALFDQNTFVSAASYRGTGLADIYTAASADALITTDPSLVVYTYDISEPSTAQGFAFFVRTGTTGNYHYAKVYVSKDAAGSYVRDGGAKGKYVEVQMSYQSNPNTPYTKSVARKLSPLGHPATSGK